MRERRMPNVLPLMSAQGGRLMKSAKLAPRANGFELE